MIAIIGIDNFIGGYEDNVSKHIEFHKVDCCDFNKLNSIMIGVEVVYHCAATAHEGLSVFSPCEITKNNYQASVSVFSASINNKVKRTLCLQSSLVLGGRYTCIADSRNHPKNQVILISKNT